MSLEGLAFDGCGWVDFLCIIQNSVDDWAQEAASMIDIYQDCSLSFPALEDRIITT